MTDADRLPVPMDLEREKDPSKRLLALVEPATNLLVRATTVAEADEVHARAEALARYARSIRLSTDAIGAAQTIARMAEVRMGELLPPQQGRRTDRELAGNNGQVRGPAKGRRREGSQDSSVLRRMARNRPKVEEVLGELAPAGKASRHAVLRAIRQDDLRETREHEAVLRPIDQSPIGEMTALRTDLRRVVKKLRNMRDLGQTFSAARLAKEVKTLCREMEELL